MKNAVTLAIPSLGEMRHWPEDGGELTKIVKESDVGFRLMAVTIALTEYSFPGDRTPGASSNDWPVRSLFDTARGKEAPASVTNHWYDDITVVDLHVIETFLLESTRDCESSSRVASSINEPVAMFTTV
jgi:hypothetical protein